MLTTLKCSADYLLALRHLVKRDPTDEENVKGKNVIITGANSGIGKATASELAAREANVIMACRNKDLAQKAVNDIRAKTDKGNLIIMDLDLGDTVSIKKFAEEYKAKFNRLDILINNAGVSDQNGVLSKTKDGFESHIGINHIGHFLLTNLLLEQLKAAAPSRVISVSSFFYVTSNLNLDDLNMEKAKNHGVGNLHPYGNSKLANMLFIKELAKRLEGTGVTAYAVCPGMTNTNVFRTQPWYKSCMTKLSIKIAGFTPEQGCQTILFCALSKKLANESGKMYRFGHHWENSMEKLDPEVAAKLWTKTEELLSVKK